MELRGVRDDLLREFERGKRCEQRNVYDDAVANDGAREWSDVPAGGFDFVAARGGLEREPSSYFFGKFRKSDYVRRVWHGCGAKPDGLLRGAGGGVGFGCGERMEGSVAGDL
jgi:hypothetical protein